jgi:hypothetical protein
LAFGRRFAKNQVLHADVLVQLRPVNPATTPDELPILPFLCCPMAKARVPRQWYGNRATIREFCSDVVIRNDECSHADVLCVNRGKSHSRNPSIVGDVRLQSARSAAIPSPRSRLKTVGIAVLPKCIVEVGASSRPRSSLGKRPGIAHPRSALRRTGTVVRPCHPCVDLHACIKF